jgi:putative cardiolipin synthase
MAIDDLNTMLHDDMSRCLARIDRHPNIQIRVFNPWDDRSLFGRGVGMASDFKRLNRRMHNKHRIIGAISATSISASIPNSTFTISTFSASDRWPGRSQVFDRYWNSDWVRARLAPGADIPPRRIEHRVDHRQPQ